MKQISKEKQPTANYSPSGVRARTSGMDRWADICGFVRKTLIWRISPQCFFIASGVGAGTSGVMDGNAATTNYSPNSMFSH